MAPWFGSKARYGEGSFASWQGLVATLIALPLFFYLMNVFRPADYGWPAWSSHALAFGEIGAFLILVWIKWDREPDAP